MPSYYILNSAVITAYGKYEYTPTTSVGARTWLREHTWKSCIGYPETAEALEIITTLNGKHPPIVIPVNRQVIQMKCKWNDEKEEFEGDEALVFRLVFPSGYRLDPTQKGKLGYEFIKNNCEFGILQRIE